MSRKRKNISDELEPTVKLTSDGDLLIKSLLEKQLSTEINLQRELHRKKVFVPTTEYRSATEYVCGINSLKDLEETTQYVQKLEEFTSAGLSEEDLIFYLNKDQGVDYLKMLHKNLDGNLIEKRLAEISNILNTYKIAQNMNKTSDNVAGRLQTECMLSSKPNSLETKLLKFTLECDKDISLHNDEIEALKLIEKDLIKSADDNSDQRVNITKLAKKVQRRLRAIAKKNNSITLPVVEPSFEFSELSPIKNSMWDVKNIDSDAASNVEGNIKVVNQTQITTPNCATSTSSEISLSQQCESKNRYTIKDGIIINLKDVIDYSHCRKLNIQEIRNIPKFSQYSAGLPSKILYLKNVHSLSVNDLKQLFGSFNLTTNAINIMKGKMKGQAFVEMESCEEAKQAIEYINGIILKTKPLIIQFSSKTELPEKEK